MNEEDDLLTSMATQRREDDADWQSTLARLGLEETLLEQYAAGTLGAQERDRLESIAHGNEEAKRILTAYAPLADTFQSALLDRVAATLDEAPAAAVPQEAAPSASVTPLTPKAERRRGWRPAVAIPSALAAGLLIAVLLPALLTGPTPRQALPDYVLQVGGMTAELRSDPTQDVRVTPTSPTPAAVAVAPGNQLRLLMTPGTESEAQVSARLYLQASTQTTPQALPLDASLVRTSPSGAVRIEARVGEQLPLPNGSSRLLIVVGQEDALPTAATLAGLIGEYGGVDGGQWQAFALDITLSE
ncbi:MAG: hypothetical protein AAF184_23455 [Pseudomonadota bacterium]